MADAFGVGNAATGAATRGGAFHERYPAGVEAGGGSIGSRPLRYRNVPSVMTSNHGVATPRPAERFTISTPAFCRVSATRVIPSQRLDLSQRQGAPLLHLGRHT